MDPWVVTRDAPTMPLVAGPSMSGGGVAFVVTLLVHAALVCLCMPRRAPDPDEGEVVDRDSAVLLQPARGVFALDEPDEPPDGPSERLRREDVDMWRRYVDGPGGGGREVRHALIGLTRPIRRGCVPLPLVHEVEQGETLASIARLHGVASWRALVRHPANAWLFRQRPHPDRIFPGDRIVIPAKDDEIDCMPTGWWF